MRVARMYVIAVMLMFLCGSGPLSAQEGGDGWLQVEVSDAGGRSLSRACVTIVPRSGDIVFRRADGQGKVKVRGLAPGSYRVVVKRDGYEAQKREVTIKAGTEVVAFALPRRKL